MLPTAILRLGVWERSLLLAIVDAAARAEREHRQDVFEAAARFTERNKLMAIPDPWYFGGE